MIWVYGIAAQPALGVPRRRGLAHAPLFGVPHGELLAVVTRHEHAPVEPAPDALWAHERVVERLMADRAVLPMRFGTTLPDEQAVGAALAARHDEFVAALERVRGRVELAVRAVSIGNGAAPAAPVVPASGREYILGKLAHERQSQAAVDALHEPLARLAVDTRRQPSRQPGEVLRAAYLVDRVGVARFRSVVDRLSREHTDVGLLCTGPWPPYSFVGAPAPVAHAAGDATR